MAKTIKGIQTANEFSLRKKAYLDDREEFDTLADMASFDDVPDGFITLNKENGKRYEYNSSNTIDTDLGKWREYKSGGSISFDDWKEDTDYKKDTLVVKNSTLYICAIAHTSTQDFDDDLAGGNWNVYVGGSGTTNYNDLLNKPSINGVDLVGNKTLADLGITNYDDTQVKTDITDLQNNKVDKVIGKSLVDDTEITRLASINNYDDTQITKDIADLKADKQDKTDNTLETTDKTVVGAINEINDSLLDNVTFSADYKNIILNRKSGLNPYSIPIASIIHNAKITEFNDVDDTDIGNGKTLIYDSATQKHKYVDSTGTDELVKMDSTTDAKYLSELIDKSTVVNDNGVLKIKKLDGQDVTIAEINNLKGLTMNIMDLVNAFSNGGVKVLNTPLNTASELDTMDRTSFVDGISYIVYVLADENHSGAKTTYLVDKTNTTFFGNADSQRNFTTNPINLANEVTGKLGTSNIDVDALWKLLTINDTYKTLTTNNEIFGTHGAKAMYDELTTVIGAKANATDLTTHNDNTDIHITSAERTKWDNKANTSDIPTKVSELTNDSNYQTAKQVNSAVTTEIAKVDASLGELEEKIGKIDNLKLINAGENADANNCIIAKGNINRVYGYCGSFTQNVPNKGYAVIICYHYGSGIRQFIYYTSRTTKTYTRFIQYDGKIPTDWKELATMDSVKDGYVKIIKNNDTDIDEAMLVSYKNRELFGVRMYKKDDSEHELRFNASGISYVKNGVTVWTTRGNTGNTGVEDVGVTTITPVNSAITGTIEYTVKNGICYVSFKNVNSTTNTNDLSISATMPKSSINCGFPLIANGRNGNIGFIYIDKNTTKLNGNFWVAGIPGSCSFSYPVAES